MGVEQWVKLLSSIAAIVSTICGIGTVYLRLFVKNEINELYTRVIIEMERRYVLRDNVEEKLGRLADRVSRIEGKVNGRGPAQ